MTKTRWNNPFTALEEVERLCRKRYGVATRKEFERVVAMGYEGVRPLFANDLISRYQKCITLGTEEAFFRVFKNSGPELLGAVRDYCDQLPAARIQTGELLN